MQLLNQALNKNSCFSHFSHSLIHLFLFLGELLIKQAHFNQIFKNHEVMTAQLICILTTHFNYTFTFTRRHTVFNI